MGAEARGMFLLRQREKKRINLHGNPEDQR